MRCGGVKDIRKTVHGTHTPQHLNNNSNEHNTVRVRAEVHGAAAPTTTLTLDDHVGKKHWPFIFNPVKFLKMKIGKKGVAFQTI